MEQFGGSLIENDELDIEIFAKDSQLLEEKHSEKRSVVWVYKDSKEKWQLFKKKANLILENQYREGFNNNTVVRLENSKGRR